MKTYEELLQMTSENEIGEFCLSAVRMFEATEEYRNAVIADSYYNKHNVTIETYIKWLYTVTGRKVKDDFSADHRIKTHHFRRKVIQHANYLLGKGITLDDASKKDKLGKDIDHNILRLAKMAMVEGRSFGFWNNDHLEVFGFCCTEKHAGFCPIHSDETADLMAGIRFRYKHVGTTTVCIMTLFEIEGYSEYTYSSKDGKVKLTKPRQAYKRIKTSTKADGVIDYRDENYNGLLPIIPMYASDTYESDLVGLREAIDCYDLIKSGLANNIDDASEIYWIVKNAGGMDDVSLAQFLQRIKKTHAAQVDSEAGEEAEAHTVDIPTEAREKMLEILRTDLYDDMMLLDRRSLSAAQKTTQELDMAYQPQDDYANDLEFFVYDFMDKLLALAGIDCEVSFTRDKVVNTVEQVNMLLSCANVLSPECIIRHLPFLTPEEIEDEIRLLAEREYNSFNEKEEEEEEPTEEEEPEEGE